MRMKITISYDGSDYYGFQIQKKKEQISVQQVLEETLSRFFAENIKIVGSGRTDRGVHALKQVCHFDLVENKYTLDRILYSLNRMLPNNIHIESLEQVDDSFHARYSVKKKTYRYIINNGVTSPFLVNYAFQQDKLLDLDLMKKGMNLFVGTHNFQNFCTNKETDDFIRTIYSFEMNFKDGLILFDITGNGFRRYMVRMIMGTLIALGEHKITLDEINELINKENRTIVSYKAIPNGLYLYDIMY